jgi:hypothetical protein
MKLHLIVNEPQDSIDCSMIQSIVHSDLKESPLRFTIPFEEIHINIFTYFLSKMYWMRMFEVSTWTRVFCARTFIKLPRNDLTCNIYLIKCITFSTSHLTLFLYDEERLHPQINNMAWTQVGCSASRITDYGFSLLTYVSRLLSSHVKTADFKFFNELITFLASEKSSGWNISVRCYPPTTDVNKLT